MKSVSKTKLQETDCASKRRLDLAKSIMPKKKIDFVSKLGGNIDKYITRSKLPGVVAETTDKWISYRAYLRLIDDISRREGIPDLSFQVNNLRVEEAVLPAINKQLISAPTLSKSIERVSVIGRYQLIGLRIEQRIAYAHAAIAVRLPAPASTPGFTVSETGSILILLDLLRVFIDDRFLPTKIRLASRSQDIHYDVDTAFGGVPVVTDAPVAEILFPARYLAHVTPLLARAEGVSQQAPDWHANLPTSLSDDISHLLFGYLQQGLPTLREMSEILGISPRTLQRLLALDGTNYFRILDELRCTCALQYLSKRDLGLEDIAYLVGYAEKAPFYRAFKRWTGMTPGQFQKLHSIQETE